MGQRSKGSEVSAIFPCVQGTGIAWGQGWGTSSLVQQDCAVPNPRPQAITEMPPKRKHWSGTGLGLTLS